MYRQLGKSAAIVLVALLVLAGCATQPEPIPGAGGPGFFRGLADGFCGPISLFLGWLWHGRMYAFPNSGWLYDLGWLFGFGTWGSLLAASRA